MGRLRSDLIHEIFTRDTKQVHKFFSANNFDRNFYHDRNFYPNVNFRVLRKVENRSTVNKYIDDSGQIRGAEGLAWRLQPPQLFDRNDTWGGCSRPGKKYANLVIFLAKLASF